MAEKLGHASRITSYHVRLGNYILTIHVRKLGQGFVHEKSPWSQNSAAIPQSNLAITSEKDGNNLRISDPHGIYM